MTYVAIVGVCLFIFVPSSIYTRPIWQHLEENLHIYELPLFLMVKNVVQITFIILRKTVFRINELSGGF